MLRVIATIEETRLVTKPSGRERCPPFVRELQPTAAKASQLDHGKVLD